MIVPDVELARAFNGVRDYRDAVAAGQDLRLGLLPGQFEIRHGKATWGRPEYGATVSQHLETTNNSLQG
jgi:hypothetical protein